MNNTPIKLPRHTKGKRPYFFDDPSVDQMMTFVVEMATEISVLADRVDTLERLLERNGVVAQGAVEAYRPDDTVEKERAARRDGLVKRIFRMHHEREDA